MSKAIRIHAHGGPEVMQWDDVPTPEPGPAEALVHHTAVGLNYIDVYFRTGLYKLPVLPATLGMEAAGVVTSVGHDVTNVKPGDRVAYATGPVGAYATDRVIAADRLVRVPDGVADQTAAAMMLQGMTAQYLLRTTFRVKAGDTIVVHAAAGGVGLILCQWAKALGATVIGVVSTEAKAEMARAHGAAHVVVGHETLPAEVKRITQGAMVPVVYDSVGKDTFGGQPRQPGAPGHDGQLRQLLRPGAAHRRRPAVRPRAASTSPGPRSRPTRPSPPTSRRPRPRSCSRS